MIFLKMLGHFGPASLHACRMVSIKVCSLYCKGIYLAFKAIPKHGYIHVHYIVKGIYLTFKAIPKHRYIQWWWTTTHDRNKSDPARVVSHLCVRRHRTNNRQILMIFTFAAISFLSRWHSHRLITRCFVWISVITITISTLQPRPIA